MPFVISREMSKSFDKEGILLVDGFLPEVPFDVLKKIVEKQVANSPKDFDSRYKNGRDVFRTHEEVKKTVLKKDYQKVICELCNATKLFFAFDQIWDSRVSRSNFEKSPLQEIMSISPLTLGALLCLEGESEHPLFPKKPNELFLFDPVIPMDWSDIPEGQLFFLFGFADMGAIYKENLKDPNTYNIKRLHYQPNQPIKAKTHPIIKG
jgi:hypothetical protein